MHSDITPEYEEKFTFSLFCWQVMGGDLKSPLFIYKYV